jgi:hypothetical protein
MTIPYGCGPPGQRRRRWLRQPCQRLGRRRSNASGAPGVSRHGRGKPRVSGCL